MCIESHLVMNLKSNILCLLLHMKFISSQIAATQETVILFVQCLYE